MEKIQEFTGNTGTLEHWHYARAYYARDSAPAWSLDFKDHPPRRPETGKKCIQTPNLLKKSILEIYGSSNLLVKILKCMV